MVTDVHEIIDEREKHAASISMVAFFAPEVVLEIVRSLLMTAARSPEGRGKDCLNRWARACCDGVCGTDGRIGIRGRLGFLRTIAAIAGQSELARVEAELHRGV